MSSPRGRDATSPVLGSLNPDRCIVHSHSCQFTGVLVHRVTRPLRGSVSCGTGWSVPCVSIQLTLAQLSHSAGLPSGSATLSAPEFTLPFGFSAKRITAVRPDESDGELWR